jgi:hypothetical protein
MVLNFLQPPGWPRRGVRDNRVCMIGNFTSNGTKSKPRQTFASTAYHLTSPERPSNDPLLLTVADLADDMRPEIDFSGSVRGLHHIPPDAIVFVPASIERWVWEYFSEKAEQRGVKLSELLSEVLKRDIEIGEALK